MAKRIVFATAFLALAAVAYSQSSKKESGSAAAEESSEADPSSGQALSTTTAIAEKAPKFIDPDQADDPEEVDWTKVDWRRRLSKLQFEVTRRNGTERPFHNEFWNVFDDGQYRCVGCGLPLFESSTKFDAGCGWPSFDKPIAKNAVVERDDASHGMRRIEVRCRRCDGHLGHVFDDGPTKTGLRYCMNSAAMAFVPAKKAAKPAAAPAENDAAAAPAKGDAR